MRVFKNYWNVIEIKFAYIFLFSFLWSEQKKNAISKQDQTIAISTLFSLSISSTRFAPNLIIIGQSIFNQQTFVLRLFKSILISGCTCFRQYVDDHV